ncbi:MAG: hypothetical protein ACYTGL_20915 [Planctomycetota bacterium]
MTAPETPSKLKQVTVLAGLTLAAFAAGAVIGYVNGSSGDDGNSTRAIDWAVRTGVLLLGMMACISFLGSAVLSRLKTPPVVGWALLFGLGFSIMSGGGVLLGMNDKEFVSETFGGLLWGGILGAIAGPIIQRNNQALESRDSASESGSEDTSTT